MRFLIQKLMCILGFHCYFDERYNMHCKHCPFLNISNNK